jgi:hypothetical protein
MSVDSQAQLLADIADPSLLRDDIAKTYAVALWASEEPDWPKVNEAIIARWSLSGLSWIKNRAWKYATFKLEIVAEDRQTIAERACPAAHDSEEDSR